MNERLFDEIQEFRVVLDLGLELLLMRATKVCKRHILLAYIWIHKKRIQLAYIWILDERELTIARLNAQSTSELPLTREIAKKSKFSCTLGLLCHASIMGTRIRDYRITHPYP